MFVLVIKLVFTNKLFMLISQQPRVSGVLSVCKNNAMCEDKKHMFRIWIPAFLLSQKLLLHSFPGDTFYYIESGCWLALSMDKWTSRSGHQDVCIIILRQSDFQIQWSISPFLSPTFTEIVIKIMNCRTFFSFRYATEENLKYSSEEFRILFLSRLANDWEHQTA